MSNNLKIKTTSFIGVCGSKNSGKDVVSNMINYIIKTGLHSNYDGWFKQYDENDPKDKYIIAFGDTLKDVVSILFGIDREVFDSRNGKDRVIFDLNTGKEAPEKALYSELFVSIEHLQETSLSEHYKMGGNVYIRPRTLLQYFGTNIGRDLLYSNIWINACMKRAKHVSSLNSEARYAIVSDVRFNNESEMIKENNGIVIKINRHNNTDDHSSEDMTNVNCDFEIDNNASLLSLFYKVQQIINFKYGNCKA